MSTNDPRASIVAPREGSETEPRFRVIDQELLCRLVKERDALRSQVQYQDARMEFLRGEIGSLVNDRDALRSVLKEILEAYDNTYEAELHGDTWRGAASINFRVMERAAKLVGVT